MGLCGASWKPPLRVEVHVAWVCVERPGSHHSECGQLPLHKAVLTQGAVIVTFPRE